MCQRLVFFMIAVLLSPLLVGAEPAPEPVPMVEPVAEQSEEAKEPENEEAKTPEPAPEPVPEPHPEEPEPVAAPKVMMPEPAPIAKVMPKMPVSPVPAVPQVAPEGVAAKMISTATPVVSRAVATVTSPIHITDVSDKDIATGLDTLNVDSGGNWLEKRIWYQKSEQLFEVIRATVAKVVDLRMAFVRDVNQVGHQIDEFYESVSFQKGELDEMLSMVQMALQNQEAVRGGDLSSAERNLKQKVADETIQFEAISKDLKTIDELDEQIDKTMMKAFKEIDTCRSLETRAWSNFKEIGLELDDKKARVLYYEMENFHKNIEQKLTYLNGNLLPYLQSQLIGKVTQTIGQINTTVQGLKTQGLDLKTLLEKDEKGDLLILKEREKAKEQADLQAQKVKVPKQVAEEAWYSPILNVLHPIFEKIQEWICIVLCCVQCVLCKIKCWVCQLFGR
jgi:hypothetical protein